ncbi:MAG TPA: D-2-hydroxyacid dehydrogenase [Polyangiaceae bacterium]|jgi:glycerate dehydrogenase|nr:D-2-hydroxyacid dehydrogenase [Polyangiaceae bacterium]
MARIVVLDGHTVNPGDLGWERLAALGELSVHARTPPELLVERSLGADVLVTNKTSIDAPALAALPGLVGISVLATGVDAVDGAAARERGVVLCNVPAYSTASVAQHTIALLLELTSHVGLHAAAVRAGEWETSEDFTFWKEPLRELAGETFGVVGLGAIGQRVATLARALGMHVVATPSRRLLTPPAGVEYRSLDALLAEADVVSLHCPLTEQTRRLVRRERLLTMRPNALLVNTARGALIDEADLADALARGVIAGAALDVLGVEPPPPDHPLLRAPRCLVTPHQAWTSRSARERLLAVTVDNVRGILEGRPQNVVNA